MSVMQHRGIYNLIFMQQVTVQLHTYLKKKIVFDEMALHMSQIERNLYLICMQQVTVHI